MNLLRSILFGLSSIAVISCSNSPEKAIEKMKEKVDDYMLKGVKPTEVMIVADCSDYFDKDYKNNIKWTSKLQAFEPELLAHIENKELFDTNKHFSLIEFNQNNYYSLFQNIENVDTQYFYLKHPIIINDAVPDMTTLNGPSTTDILGERYDASSFTLFFISSNGRLEYRDHHTKGFRVEIPISKIVEQSIKGQTCNHRGYIVKLDDAPIKYHFVKSSNFRGLPTSDYERCDGYANLLEYLNGTSKQGELKFDGNTIQYEHPKYGVASVDSIDYYVWNSSENNSDVPVWDKSKISGVISGYTDGDFPIIADAKIVETTPIIDITKAKKINFYKLCKEKLNKTSKQPDEIFN